MENSKPTQAQRVLAYIEEFGSISQIEALRDLGVMRLASRVSELRKQGHKIVSKTVKVKNRWGENCHIKRYGLQSLTGDKCVCCGEVIPEGRQVCPSCEKGAKA